MKTSPLENQPPAKPAPRECPSLLAEAGADFNANKVAHVSQAIRDGRFRVDAGAIADKLIANTGRLFGPSLH